MGRLRILCLHSFRTSGAIFQRQLGEFANFEAVLSEVADLFFLDGWHHPPATRSTRQQ